MLCFLMNFCFRFSERERERDLAQKQVMTMLLYEHYYLSFIQFIRIYKLLVEPVSSRVHTPFPEDVGPKTDE
jgi:hypothetical protein